MYCYQDVCQNKAGDAQAGWLVECLSGSTVQTIYSDADGGFPLASNRAITDALGNFYFYVADGTYTLKYYNAAGVYQRTSLPITMWGADLSTSTGAGLVGFIQSGTGAVARTVQGKLRDTVSVRDFGAVGDNAADDSSAIQAALNAGAFVQLVAGETYKIGTSLNVPAGVIVAGNGAKIHYTGTANAINFANGGGAENLTVYGDGGASYLSGHCGISCKGTNNSPSAPTFVTAPLLNNIEVYGFGDYGIRLQYCQNATSHGVYVHNCGRTGIGGMSCNDVWFHGYRCRTIGPGSGGDAYGVFFDRLETGNETVDPRSYRCGVVGFDIRDVNATGGNGQGIDSHGGVDILFSNGVIDGCDVGGAFTASSISGAQALAPQRCKAKGIIIRGGHTGYGFFVVGALAGGSIVEYAEDCEIDLTIVGHGLDSALVTDGSIAATLIRGTKGLQINGQFKDNESSCIYLDRDNYGFHIEGVFTDPHADNFTAPSCIHVVGNNNKGFISGSFRYANSSLATYVCVNAVRIESGLSGLDLDFGPSTFVGIDATHLAFLALTTTGVRYNGMQKLSGSASISVVSTGADGILDVTFAKRFPYVPSVMVTLDYPFNGGGKFPIVGVDTSVAVTATGMRLYAKPVDGTSWTATGSVGVKYIAQ